jgi:hypothetical protein
MRQSKRLTRVTAVFLFGKIAAAVNSYLCLTFMMNIIKLKKHLFPLRRGDPSPTS